MRIPYWVDDRIVAWITRKQVREIAMILAVVPLLTPMPIIALLMFGGTARKHSFRGHVRAWRFVLLAATVNLAISTWLLSELAEILWATIVNWWTILPELLPTPRSDPQPVPV